MIEVRLLRQFVCGDINAPVPYDVPWFAPLPLRRRYARGDCVSVYHFATWFVGDPLPSVTIFATTDNLARQKARRWARDRGRRLRWMD